MIEKSDIIKIDRGYFEIVEIKDFVIVIRSRNNRTLLVFTRTNAK